MRCRIISRLGGFFGLLLLSGFLPVRADVYVVYYATYRGKTGHVGLAVDRYTFRVTETAADGGLQTRTDTVVTGELDYYDLWPDEDQFSVWNTGRNIRGVYYVLPLASQDEITLRSLYAGGLPHKENYPTDGILRIRTSWEQDQQLRRFIDSLVQQARPFNARRFNCTDFVRLVLERHWQEKIRCREFVGLGWSATPNKLYRRLRERKEVELVKNGDEKARYSFIGQRVWYKLWH